MKKDKSFLMLIPIFCIIVGGILFYGEKNYSEKEEPAAAETVQAFIVYEDAVIFPEHVKGLSIQKYSVASAAGDTWGYSLEIHGVDDQEIWFDDRDAAENAMIEIAEACGI